MATLTDVEKLKIRRAAARKAVELGVPVVWVKAEMAGAAQAVEDVLDSAALQTSINSAIEGAAPGLFSVAQKRWLVALVMEVKYTRDIIG